MKIHAGDFYKSNPNVLGADIPVGVGSAKVHVESLWDWDDEDNGVVMDIEDLLSEFGDFGDFFEDDLLAFGEGELQIISWFQFLPCDSDSHVLSAKSFKGEQKDNATLPILSAHLSLQNEGFLTSWTNSFIGPWDPSQGVHNPDEKIKLWLFLPGRHSAVVDAAKASLSGLRVVANGVWLAPGDLEEVATALSQALRNRIERALRGFSYLRYGDVFIKSHSSSTIEINSRRVQPALEFMFSANEEAIYVHTVISMKNVRGLSNSDLEKVLKLSSSGTIREGLPVIVAPHGMRGRVTGCCPSDLVKEVYSRKLSNESPVIGVLSQSASCQLRGQSCYVEVTIGFASDGPMKALKSNLVSYGGTSQHHTEKYPMVTDEIEEEKHGHTDRVSFPERTMIFPVETLLVPILYRVFARSSLKRMWLHGSSATHRSSVSPLWDFPDSFFITYCLGFGGQGDIKLADSLVMECADVHPQCDYNEKRDSNGSSISSMSSTTSDGDDATRELEADADSLSCRQSSLSSNDRLEKDSCKSGYKRSRKGTIQSFGHTGKLIGRNAGDFYKSNPDVLGADIPAGVGSAKVQVESLWDWDDEDNGVVMDIEDLLSEFGDFGDFFEDDLLAFGEPPGTAESQTLIFSGNDGRDITTSPIMEKIDVSDQNPLPGSSFQSFEDFQHTAPNNNEFLTQNVQPTKDSGISVAGNVTTTSKFDYLAKAEAIITLASEYSAVETPVSEFLTAIFRTPYLPKSKRVDSLLPPSSTCIYGASPPCSPRLRLSEAKAETGCKLTGIHELTYYNHVNGWKTHVSKKSSTDNETSSLKDDHLSVSGITLPSHSTTFQSKNMENTLEVGHLVLSLKTVLATVVECSMLQAALCRIRHLLLSCNDQFPMEIDIYTGQRVSDQLLKDPCIKPILTSAKYEMKKKDHVPIRIAGDIDAAIDRPVTAPVGVWRSVGASKAIKSSNTNAENSSSFPISSFIEEDFSMINQKHPLQKILDAIPFLIQQSTSFVDVPLDACNGDGPYDWLALDEQVRRGFACGPSAVHAGCGGVLASCHSLDIAGVDLVHPLSSDVHASSVSSLLFSEVKVAVKSAFKNLDGPLSIVDWCRGHGQSGDAMITGDILSAECLATEANDSSSTGSFPGESISPSTNLAAGTSSLKDMTRMDEPYQRHSNQANKQQLGGLQNRSPISLLPSPALLVGYQDDWLKTSANCLGLWEKAPLEPYAHPKPVTYIAVCPDIDILTSATADFLLQIGTVYEACKLGTHSPHLSGMQIDTVPHKSCPSGLVLIDCPQTLKAGVIFTSTIGSVNDYLQALSKSWDLNDFLITLANSLKALKLGSVLPVNKVDGSNASCTVVYVICPFPDSAAITQTLVEASAALGSAVYASEKESRTLLHSQVAKDLSCAAALDEASISNVTMLSGFSIPKLVLQIVTLDLLLRVDKPRSELAFLKDLAFTVYNKARRIVRSFSNFDIIQSSSFPVGRTQSTLMHVSFPAPGLWKGEHDSALRPGTWDNSWQTLRTGGLNCDSNRSFELFPQDDLRCMFEPLFILAEPGYVEHGISFVGSTVLSESSNSRSLVDDSSSSYMQASGSGGNADVSSSSILDGSDHEHKTPSLHCCYGWTEDWRWLISIWTDSKGELLDSQIFPFGGISSRQDTKVLQCLFVQILHQGCQIMSSSSSDSGSIKARDIIITRIGCFFELECQEWQKAIYSLGGNEIKKWPVQLRKSLSGISLTNNGTSLQQQDISLVQERSIPSSPIHSMYSPHVKSSGYMKGASGQSSFKKTFSGNQVVDPCGLSQLVQSISLVAVSVDHTLHLMLPADSSCLGGIPQTSCSSNPSGYLDGFSAIKSLGTISSSYLIIPHRGVRYLPATPMQLPTCLTSESPPLAHLLHSKGSAIPLSTGYVVSKAVPNVRRGSIGNNNEWPSILLVSLVDYYGRNTDNFQEKMVRGGNISNSTKQARSSGLEANIRDSDLEKHLVLESVSAELHSLSWLTASPVYPERRTALPFHCDMLLRSRRLLYYADKQLTRQPVK